MPVDDSDDFSNNPFRLLNFSSFVSIREDKAGKPGIEPAERELFLRAVRNLPAPAVASKKQGGFALGELCMLPEIMPKRKKHTLPGVPEAAPVKKETQTRETEDSDEQLFAVAMRNTARLVGNKGRKVPAARPEMRNQRKPAEVTLADYMSARLEFAVSCSDEYLEGHAVGLDELIMNRLREGQLSPEAHLDLHGLNAEQAFETLREFMRQAWFKGLRSVLVVTGRGRNSPAGLAILRQKLPYWLTHEPFKRIVLAFCTARPHDGGPGSIYVLLRRARKKGPVRWETLAFDVDGF